MHEWTERLLGDIVTLNYGWNLPEKSRVIGNFPVYGSNGVVGTHNIPLVPSCGIIVGRKGSAGIVHLSTTPFCPIDTTFFIEPSDSHLDIQFLFFLLKHLDLKRLAADVGVPGLNREAAYHESVRFPSSLTEQHKIGAILSLVQRAIKQQNHLLALTTELKTALLQKLFAEGLRGEPQKQTEIGPLPQSWKIVRFEEFATLQRGYDLPRQSFRHGKYPVVGATTVIGYHDTYNVPGPGVTIVRSGSSVGKPLYVDSDFWAHNVLLYVKNFHGNLPKFVYYKLLTLDIPQYRQGVAVPTLKPQHLQFRTCRGSGG